MMRGLTTIVLTAWASLAFAQTAKPTINLPDSNLYPGTPGQQLQQAVNDPGNAGKILHLASGVYTLDPTAGPPSYAGRLYLQQGMEIVGENEYVDCKNVDGASTPDGMPDLVIDCGGAGNPDQFTTGSPTVIDGTAVTGQESTPAGLRPTGLVRLGRDNAVSRVTIFGANTTNVIGDIHINLPSLNDGVIRATVTDTIIDGGSRGIYCQNPPLIAGTTALVTLTRNIIRNTTIGIQFINANTEGNHWEGVVQHNRSSNNVVGMFMVGNQSTFAETQVFSFRNLFENNRAGIVIQVGQDGGGQIQPPRGGTNNRFTLVSQEDVIRNNTGNIGIAELGGNRFGGGAALAAGDNSSPRPPLNIEISPSTGNGLVAQFLDTQFIDNVHRANATDPGTVSHLEVLGYRANPTRTQFGTDNQGYVSVRLPSCDLNPSGFSSDDSDPDEIGSLTNKAYLSFVACANPASLSTISSDFNGTPIAEGNSVWLNANFSVSGLRTDISTTIQFRDSTVTINGEPHPVPSGTIVFDPAANCASTTFGFGGWTTVVPTSGSDEILLSGLRIPAIDGIPGGASASWSGRFFADQPGLTLQWKWGAAVYATSLAYTSMHVKPAHTNACGISNSDHAGTPEAMKSGYLIGGARGGGGSNYTGGWTGTLSVQPNVY